MKSQNTIYVTVSFNKYRDAEIIEYLEAAQRENKGSEFIRVALKHYCAEAEELEGARESFAEKKLQKSLKIYSDTKRRMKDYDIQNKVSK